MGALTRKRSDDCFTLNYKSPAFDSPIFDHHRHDTRISKKPKFSPSTHQSTNQSLPSRSIFSKFYRYPDPVHQFRREVHAPCRAPKFGFAANSKLSGGRVSDKGISAGIMGNVLGYEKAERSVLDALWYAKKDKNVIEVDDTETTFIGDDVLEDSSDEEVKIVEDRREGRSVVSDQKSKETEVAVANLQKTEGKGVECNFQPSSSSVVSDTAKVESDSLSLFRYLKVLGMPLHKKLLDLAEARNPKLSSLRFQIEINEKRRAMLQLFWPWKKPKALVSEPFVPLSKEEETEVDRSFSSSNRRKVLVTHENSNIEITGEILQCLRPRAWLNDEVINLYLELLKEREKREPKKFLKCHFFSTFFYKKLITGREGYDFKPVRRWTTQKKLGYYLLECDKIFVPIHKEIHWCLAVINKKDEKFQYLDSLRGEDHNIMKVLAKYFVDEVKDKSGKDIDVSSWKQEFVMDLPEQENGFDCGMFMIKYADFYSRDIGLCFNQEHMPYFRLRTAKEILRLRAE